MGYITKRKTIVKHIFTETPSIQYQYKEFYNDNKYFNPKDNRDYFQ